MVNGIGMRAWWCVLLLVTLPTMGCAETGGAAGAPPELTPSRAAEVDSEVRSFMATVARDVTREGPAAWRHLFTDGPSFFMASDGQLVFPTGAAAAAANPQLVRAIHSIELTWGTDLRVDPLTPSLAVVASSFHEVRMEGAGNRVEESGFFSGTAELLKGHWQFRNAHWSDPRPSAP